VDVRHLRRVSTPHATHDDLEACVQPMHVSSAILGLRDARESLGSKASTRLQKRPQDPTPQEQIYTAWKNLDFGGMGIEHPRASARDLFTRVWTYPSSLPPPLCLLRPCATVWLWRLLDLSRFGLNPPGDDRIYEPPVCVRWCSKTRLQGSTESCDTRLMKRTKDESEKEDGNVQYCTGVTADGLNCECWKRRPSDGNVTMWFCSKAYRKQWTEGENPLRGEPSIHPSRLLAVGFCD
jgi:hypothetical protein